MDQLGTQDIAKICPKKIIVMFRFGTRSSRSCSPSTDLSFVWKKSRTRRNYTANIRLNVTNTQEEEISSEEVHQTIVCDMHISVRLVLHLYTKNPFRSFGREVLLSKLVALRLFSITSYSLFMVYYSSYTCFYLYKLYIWAMQHPEQA